MNDFSVGIELIATHDSGFTDEQYCSLRDLGSGLRERLVQPVKFVGHEHIAGRRAVEMGLRDDAKNDPGPCLEWPRFHEPMGEDKAD